MEEFIYPLRIYIEDTDYAGIVFHANYLKFFERARSEWAEVSGFGIQWQREQGLLFPIRYAKVDFLKPAYVHEKVEVVTRIAKINPASIVYDQYLRSVERPGTIICKAEVKIVCVDKTFRPCALPETFIAEKQF